MLCHMRAAGTVMPGECERQPRASPAPNSNCWCPAHCSPAYLECSLSPHLVSQDTDYLDCREFLKACSVPGALLGALYTSSH